MQVTDIIPSKNWKLYLSKNDKLHCMSANTTNMVILILKPSDFSYITMTKLTSTFSPATDGSATKTGLYNIMETGNTILYLVGGYWNNIATIVSIDKRTFSLIAVNSLTILLGVFP